MMSSLPLAFVGSAQGSLAATFWVGMTSRHLPMTRDAKDRTVVELRWTTARVGTYVMGLKRLLGKIAAAPLTFAVSSDEQLPSLARRKPTARVCASHGRAL